MSEKKIEKRVAGWAKDHGWYCRKFSSPSQVGVPDRLFLKDKRVVFIEFKAPGNTPTALQWVEIALIRQQGIEADWADSFERAKEILEGDYEPSSIEE